jgi:mannose-1-phosphate guanylyltransferase
MAGANTMENQHTYFIILAGGNGERLWPLSRKRLPKQLLELTTYNLLQETINRIDPSVPKENIWIVTTATQEQAIRSSCGSMVGTILAEQSSRNTGPAILLSCLQLYHQDPEALCVFLPADHYIADKNAFRKALKTAIFEANNQKAITLLGHVPSFPATGYGYIEYNATINDNIQSSIITKFHEKPKLETAQSYYLQPNMLWNIGIFCGNASIFIEQYKNYAPKLYAAVVSSISNPELYEKVENISIDFAIMEHSKTLQVLPVAFEWSDVGNLDIFLSLKNIHGALSSDTIAINSDNNLIDVKNKIVALIGVDNMCVVETDDALLIAQRNQVEDVKKVVQILKLNKRNNLL